MSGGLRWSWKLEQLLPSPAAARAELVQLEAKAGVLAASSAGVAERFAEWEALGARIERVRVYAGNRSALAPDDPECELDLRSAFALSGRHDALLEPLRLQIARSSGAAGLPEAKARLLARGVAASDEATARVLALMSDQRLQPHFTYLALVREARASGSKTPLLDHEGSLGGLLVAKAKWDVFEARVRGHASALAAALAPDGFTPAMYGALVRRARAGAPLMHRIVALRERVGGRPVRLEDLGAPLTTGGDGFSAERARSEIIRSLSPLGAHYQHDAAHALDPGSGWIDSRHRPGPAFTEPVYAVHPYVSLDYRDRLTDAFTLVHELGHALHVVHAARAQSFAAYEPPVVLNELIANLHEELLYASMIDGAPTELRAALAVERLRNLETTFFGPIVLAELEQWVHESVERDGALTGGAIGEHYLELTRVYYGPELVLGAEDRARWARSGQLFGARFYHCAHALGLALAIVLAARLRRAEAGLAQAVLQLMRAGGSESAPELCARAGVDLGRGAYVDEALALVSEELDRREPELLARRRPPVERSGKPA